MSRQQLEDMQDQLDHLLTTLDKLERSTDKMQTVLMVREPSSSAAAEAYEGLRKQVISTATERRAHLAQLAEFDVALRGGAQPAQMLAMVEAWADQAGLARITRTEGDDVDLLYEQVGDEGGDLEVTRAAYVDGRSGQVVRRGRVRRRPLDESPSAPATGLRGEGRS